MPNIPNTSRAQTIFLRAYHKNPHGPPPDLWPSPAIFRKWLRRPTFRKALLEIQETLRLQADLHLATAANRAALTLACSEDDQSAIPNPQSALDLLKLSHIRQRFEPEKPDEQDNPMAFFRKQDPAMPVGTAIMRFLTRDKPGAIPPYLQPNDDDDSDDPEP